jgi:hypothetical protein
MLTRPALLLFIVVMAALTGCPVELTPATSPAEVDGAAVLALGGDAFGFRSLQDGARYQNGFPLRVVAPVATEYVVYSADGWVLGVAVDAASDFAATAMFTVLGRRTIVARAFKADDTQLAEARVTVEVLPAGAATATPTVAFLSPAQAEGWYQNGIWLKAVVGGNVRSVRYSADGWRIGSSADLANDFALRHTFSLTGRRMLLVEGLDDAGRIVARAERPIVVVAEGGDAVEDDVEDDAPLALPYFYQYENRLHPGASCQNTSIAMVLGAFGWRGVPDDITARHGKDRAQSPAGLAAVFNEEAARIGIAARLSPRTSGTIAQLRALLAAGTPVIIHGYFTGFGHVLVARGFDGDSYVVHDPAGTWNQRFGGGYPNGWEPVAGRSIRYPRAAFERAVASFDGRSIADGTLWFHEVR